MDKNDLRNRIARHYAEIFRLFGKHASPGVLEESVGWRRIVTKLPHFIANMAILDSGEDLEPLQRAVQPLVSPDYPASTLFLNSEVPSSASHFLIDNGFSHSGGMPLMAVDTATLEATELPAGVEFVESSADDCQAWAKSMEDGFGLPAGTGLMCAGAVADDNVRLFAARENGRILSTSMLFIHDDLAGIYCVATLPEARSRGLGAHVTAEPLRIAAREGCKSGILQSSQAGYPIYKRLGFEEVGSMPIFIRDPGMGKLLS